MTDDTNAKLKPALIGGVSLGVASAIPIVNWLNCACCALVVGGGVLASYMYMKDQPPSARPPYGDGAIVGLLAGIIGAVVGSVVQIPFTMFSASLGMFSGIESALEEAGAPEQVTEILSGLGAGGFALGAMIVGLFFSLFIYSAFATGGALIGVAVFHKKTTDGAS